MPLLCTDVKTTTAHFDVYWLQTVRIQSKIGACGNAQILKCRKIKRVLNRILLFQQTDSFSMESASWCKYFTDGYKTDSQNIF